MSGSVASDRLGLMQKLEAALVVPE